MFRAALTIFLLLFLPYLVFVLPQRLRRLRSARVRYLLFLVVITAGIFFILKRIR